MSLHSFWTGYAYGVASVFLASAVAFMVIVFRSVRDEEMDTAVVPPRDVLYPVRVPRAVLRVPLPSHVEWN